MKVPFAVDSPLEGGGFEPPVPLANESSLRRNERCRRAKRRVSTASVILLGTERTNPASSTNEGWRVLQNKPETPVKDFKLFGFAEQNSKSSPYVSCSFHFRNENSKGKSYGERSKKIQSGS